MQADIKKPAACPAIWPEGSAYPLSGRSPTSLSTLHKRQPICQPFALILFPSLPHDKLPIPSGLQYHISDWRMEIHWRLGPVSSPGDPPGSYRMSLIRTTFLGQRKSLHRHYGKLVSEPGGQIGNKSCSYLLCFLQLRQLRRVPNAQGDKGPGSSSPLGRRCMDCGAQQAAVETERLPLRAFWTGGGISSFTQRGLYSSAAPQVGEIKGT